MVACEQYCECSPLLAIYITENIHWYWVVGGYVIALFVLLVYSIYRDKLVEHRIGLLHDNDHIDNESIILRQ